MKQQELFDELASIARNLGVTIKKEKGSFKSGYCRINDKEFVLLNKMTPLEVMNSILGVCLSFHAGEIFLKPVIRDFIEKEQQNNPDQYLLEVNELLQQTAEKEKKSKKTLKNDEKNEN